MPSFSIIIPAYNEVAALPETLRAVEKAAALYRGNFSAPVEVIVVDNNSTDGTAKLALGLGAKVVQEEKRQIARARNRGAEEARYEVLLFCDADTRLHPETLLKMSDFFKDEKAIGGGLMFVPDEETLTYGIGLFLWEAFSRIFQVSGGNLFCRRDVFQILGGFPERFYIGEEVAFQFKMKLHAFKQGKKTGLLQGCKAVTSMRKIREHGPWKYAWAVFRCFFFPWLAMQKKFCSLWYDVRKT
jgi:glycosyltransferase involved in cell wall biosynthesis